MNQFAAFLHRMTGSLLLSLMIAFTLVPNANGADSKDQEHARLVVHLLGYLAKDYGGAVENGVVKSQSEYAEQVEFAGEVFKASQQITALKERPDLALGVRDLREMILAKASADDVARKARVLQAKVIQATALAVSPSSWPSMAKGAQIFAQQCVGCHGQQGAGDGPDGAKLDPKPANFHNPDAMATASPVSLYNTIRLGVPGTGMRPYIELAEEDSWALAFYVQSLRARMPLTGKPPVVLDRSRVATALAQTKTTLNDVATSTDASLAERLKTVQGSDVDELVAQVRLFEGSTEQVAVGATEGDGLPTDGAKAQGLLRQAATAYSNGDVAAAKNLALKAYIEGFEPLEPKLKALDAAFVTRIETEMAAVRARIDRQEDKVAILAAIDGASASLGKVASLVSDRGGMSPTLAFSAAAAIILREGFEAVLIVIALLSVIRAAGAPVAALYVHAGWISALLLGAGCWFLAGWLMVLSGAGREALEGVTSLLAVAILLVVGFWLHSQTELGRWKRFINGKVRDALQGGSLWTLASIAFIAVFREAIETVLFLRAIWIDSAADAQMALFAGVVVSLAAVIFLSWLILRFSVGIPIRALFSASSLVMAILATVLTGKGLHALQETGLVPETDFAHFPRVDLLGLFPTWETALSQIAMLILVGALWFYGRRPSNRAAA